jgi:hypothetical protein
VINIADFRLQSHAETASDSEGRGRHPAHKTQYEIVTFRYSGSKKPCEVSMSQVGLKELQQQQPTDQWNLTSGYDS